MDEQIHLYVAKGTAAPHNPRFDSGAEQGLLLFVNPAMIETETQLAVHAERVGWCDLQLFQKGTISKALVEQKGDPHLSAWLDAKHDGLAVIVYREE
jgi:hypothetical protein